MRVLGLDVGQRTVGVAVSDETRLIAQGVTTIRRTTLEADFEAIDKLIAEYEVTELVSGWPSHLSGKVSGQARRVEKFIDALKEHCGLPIWYQDERLTTVSAERALLEGDVSRSQRKEVIDKVAATIILQTWLDCERRKLQLRENTEE